MNSPAAYRKATSLGIRLEVRDGNLYFDAPVGVMTPEIRSALTEEKAAITRFLSDPLPAPVEACVSSLDGAPVRWNASDPAGPGTQASAGVPHLRREAARPNGKGTRDDLNEEGLPLEASRGYLAELADKGQEILARADALIAETEGRRPPSNPTVHAMFDAARARFGHRDIEDRSLTLWLHRNFPDVFLLWPDAPLDAAWFDWRLHVPATAVPQIDAALQAVCPSIECCHDLPVPERCPGPAASSPPTGTNVKGGDPMKVTKFLSSYLKSADLKQPATIIIERVVEETFERDGHEESKLVLYAKGASLGVVLSKTMINQIVEILGSDDTDDWVGKKVVMFTDPDVWFQGKKVGGIRFRASAPPKGAQGEEESPF